MKNKQLSKILMFFPLVSPTLFFITFIILGLVTPGYKSLNYTISRLAIEKYGWIMQLNFFQFSLGILLTGNLISNSITNLNSKKFIKYLFYFCSLLLFLEIFFKADPVGNIPFRLTNYSSTGSIHVLIVGLFLILSPYGIYKLSDIIKNENLYKKHYKLTNILGYGTVVLSSIWFVFYYEGWFLEYRGLFQKTIAFIVIIWMTTINISAYQHSKSESKN